MPRLAGLGGSEAPRVAFRFIIVLQNRLAFPMGCTGQVLC